MILSNTTLPHLLFISYIKQHCSPVYAKNKYIFLVVLYFLLQYLPNVRFIIILNM